MPTGGDIELRIADVGVLSSSIPSLGLAWTKLGILRNPLISLLIPQPTS